MRKWLKLDKSEKIDKVSKQIPSEPIPVDHVVFAKYERVFPDDFKARGLVLTPDPQYEMIFSSKEDKEDFDNMSECEKKLVMNALFESLGGMYLKICEESMSSNSRHEVNLFRFLEKR
jgi:hypothetical protein